MGKNRSEQQCFNSDMKALLRQRLLGKRAAQSPFSFRRRKALDRIEDGSFGVCEDCDEEIGIPRLKARPMTTLCIECKSRREEEERLHGD